MGPCFLAGKHQLLIDGKLRDAKSGKRFDDFDPATGQTIAAVAEADAADVDEAVKAARQAFETGPWARTSPADRCPVRGIGVAQPGKTADLTKAILRASNGLHNEARWSPSSGDSATNPARRPW